MMDTKRMRVCSYLLPEPGCGVVRDCLDEIERLNGLLDIAYDHLLGAGYERDGVTLQQLETGCTKTPNVK